MRQVAILVTRQFAMVLSILAIASWLSLATDGNENSQSKPTPSSAEATAPQTPAETVASERKEKQSSLQNIISVLMVADQ
ncbi:MAG: hypothetical protein F6K50_19295 [Moorea sp. SIO3I7]|uniref:hypothetical protein n=1 Tax=unclassified Moorena TaxID=2683338 RepID=UPI0013C1F28F|nr:MULTISPECIES: hypothetical protein [unclassified Moorena]NEN97590.1 hypothetical protein [Moorena sp. SIO3I7]NEO06302.1 hypothetical protein [Moorena sp. SIO3I8]NEO20299.1 hypothetical protein [Moorena sp. SIO4A5]NEP24059.1 hypothetical protein [Moorena sp. SIO3I6]NEQ60367.1 hypothetical protein [Moorena sp. SIO4A1]